MLCRGVAAAAAGLALLTAAPAAAEPEPVDPVLIEHTEWVHWGDLSSLRVYPTATGRAEAARLGSAAQAEQAWAEVLVAAPDADLPGMREQFVCHWEWAELVEPGKTSWNLEPWRPLVDDATMLTAGCNPGGTEEPF